jgi:hypothetical protein
MRLALPPAKRPAIIGKEESNSHREEPTERTPRVKKKESSSRAQDVFRFLFIFIFIKTTATAETSSR